MASSPQSDSTCTWTIHARVKNRFCQQQVPTVTATVVSEFTPPLSTIDIAGTDWSVYAGPSAVDWPFGMSAGRGGSSSRPPPRPRVRSVLWLFCVCRPVRASWPTGVSASWSLYSAPYRNALGPFCQFLARTSVAVLACTIAWSRSLRAGVCPRSQGHAAAAAAASTCACCLFLFFYYEQSYLNIYWTDFHNLFTV